MPVDKNHYSLMAAICASLFSTPLMMAGVNAALPEIGASFQTSAMQLSLVGSSYSLGLAIFTLASGSIGDIYGHRRVFLSGGIIFGVASATGAIVNIMWLFLLMRFIQGVGGALMSSSGLALLAACSKPENRPDYLGISGMAVYGGIACGPPVSGFITGAFGWRWLFIINAVTCALVWALMKFTATHEWRPSENKSYDWQGALLYAVMMGILTCISAVIRKNLMFALVGFGILFFAMAGFLLRERKADFPVLDLRLLKGNLVLSFSALAAFVNYASFFGLIFYYSFYLQIAKGLTVEQTGLILAVQAIAQICATKPAAFLCKRWNKNTVCATGAALCGLGLCAAAFLEPGSHLWIFFLTQILLGSGISAFALANTAIILENAGKAVGQASALIGAVRTAGQLCGMIFITLTLSFFLGQEPVTVNTLQEFTKSMHFDLIIFGLLNLLAIGCIFFRVQKLRQVKDY